MALEHDNLQGDKEVKSGEDLSALPDPPPIKDRLHVRKTKPGALRISMICLAATVCILAIVRFPQSSIWEMWARNVEPKGTNEGDEKHERNVSIPLPHTKAPKSGRKTLNRTAHVKDLSPTLTLSPDELALGFDKARWRMSINDAKALWPLQEPTIPTVVNDPNGPHLYPIHEENTLSLEHYTYAGCTFSVEFKFEDNKLSRLQMEANEREHFNLCRSGILAALNRQYGEAPLSPYHGYSLHASWRGPSTVVVYNEIQGAVIDVIFSASDVLQ